jgi:hypothetical protein
MLKNVLIIWGMLAAGIYLSGCNDSGSITGSENTTGTSTGGDLLYEKPGLLDSLNGTCSSYLVRNHFLDTINMSQYSTIRIEFSADTDGDRSNLIMYYFANGVTNLFQLEGLEEINGNKFIDIPAPNYMSDVHFQLRLFASICTGQYYHLSVRDLKIYGVQ